MKKVLMILAAGFFTLQGFSQERTIGDPKPSRETKTATLNGKSFRITVGEQTVTQMAPDAAATQNSQGIDNTTVNTTTQGGTQNTTITQDRTTVDPQMGTINNTTGTQTTTVDPNTGTVNNTTGTQTTTVDPNTGTVNTTQNTQSTTINDQNTATQMRTHEQTGINPTVRPAPGTMHMEANVNRDYSKFEESMKGKKFDITFTESEMQCTMHTEEHQFVSCPYAVSASSGSMATFYSNCRNPDGINSQIAGMVDGNTISGNMTYALPGGKIVKHAFTGKAMTAKMKRDAETSEVKESK